MSIFGIWTSLHKATQKTSKQINKNKLNQSLPVLLLYWCKPRTSPLSESEEFLCSVRKAVLYKQLWAHPRSYKCFFCERLGSRCFIRWDLTSSSLGDDQAGICEEVTVSSSCGLKKNLTLKKGTYRSSDLRFRQRAVSLSRSESALIKATTRTARCGDRTGVLPLRTLQLTDSFRLRERPSAEFPIKRPD